MRSASEATREDLEELMRQHRAEARAVFLSARASAAHAVARGFLDRPGQMSLIEPGSPVTDEEHAIELAARVCQELIDEERRKLRERSR